MINKKYTKTYFISILIFIMLFLLCLKEMKIVEIQKKHLKYLFNKYLKCRMNIGEIYTYGGQKKPQGF